MPCCYVLTTNYLYKCLLHAYGGQLIIRLIMKLTTIWQWCRCGGWKGWRYRGTQLNWLKVVWKNAAKSVVVALYTLMLLSHFSRPWKRNKKKVCIVSPSRFKHSRGHRMNFASNHFPFQGINRSTPWYPIIEKRTLLPINRANPTQPFTRSRQAPKTPSNCNIVQTHAPTTYLIFASNLLTSWWCPRVVYSACARGAYYIVLYIYQFTVKVLWSCEEAEMRSLNAIKIMLNKAKANENQV